VVPASQNVRKTHRYRRKRCWSQCKSQLHDISDIPHTLEDGDGHESLVPAEGTHATRLMTPWPAPFYPPFEVRLFRRSAIGCDHSGRMTEDGDLDGRTDNIAANSGPSRQQRRGRNGDYLQPTAVVASDD
jgi:hypothetical protein